VLQASVELLRARCPESRIAALSANPAATAAAYGIRAYHRTHPREVLAALRESDLLLSGGGSLLQDRTSLRSLLYYLGIIRLALGMRRRVMVFAQGIGPLTRPPARRLTTVLLARSTAITVRDAASRDLLQSLPGGKRLPPIEITADPAFALVPEETDRVRAILAEAGSVRPMVAINLRPWPGMETAARAVAEAIRSVAKPASFLACPMQAEEDGPLCDQIASARGSRCIAERLSPREWRAVLGSADLVIAARLHALALAAAGGVPTVAIEYDPKVKALRERLGGASLGEPDGITAPEVGAWLSNDYGGEAGRAERLAVAAELRQAAARNADVAMEVVSG
jgi:polysaccharide pyruvyl transferase CsaB